MARLSQVQRERSFGMLIAGRSIAEEAAIFACTRPTIYMLQGPHRTGRGRVARRLRRPGKFAGFVSPTCVYLRHRHENVLPWPAKSPDVSPIDHIWDELGRKVRKRRYIHTLDYLQNALIDEWNNLPADTVQRYLNSMRRRLVACIDANGGQIPLLSDTVDCHTVTSPYITICVSFAQMESINRSVHYSGRLNVIFTHF